MSIYLSKVQLLSNAIKFTEQGRVVLRALVGGDEVLPTLRFEVEDSGIGIPLEQQAEIFIPFRQVGDKQVQYKGTGLGLPISQKLVRMMGGELWVESGDDGSLFWFEVSLPEAVDLNEIGAFNDQTAIGYTRTAGTEPFKLLLVDDFIENRMVLNAFLRPLGFIIDGAADGAEAIEQVAQFKPDLILMDIIMPTMDGLEATRRIRLLPEWQQTPIIAISASISPESRRKSLAAGCDDFLPKPVETTAVLDKLHKYLPLEWVYDAVDKQTLEPQPVQSSSRKVLEDLLELSIIGDIMGIKEHLAVLEKDAQHTVFVIRLNHLVADFKMDEIERSIRDYLEEK